MYSLIMWWPDKINSRLCHFQKNQLDIFPVLHKLHSNPKSPKRNSSLIITQSPSMSSQKRIILVSEKDKFFISKVLFCKPKKKT